MEPPVVRFKIVGTRNLLVHNAARLVNPLDPATLEIKKLTGKQKKTPADHLEIARLEARAGMYWDEDLGPVIPSWNLVRAMAMGMGKVVKGKGADALRSLSITEDMLPISYEGPRDMESLTAVGDNPAANPFLSFIPVKVGQARTMRCRVQFPAPWSLEGEIAYEDDLLSADQIGSALRFAGRVGLGDYRPRYGRFEVASFR